MNATARRRILLLLPFTPRLDSRHGGRATAQLAGRLADRHDVALICLRPAGEGPVDEHLRARCALVEEIPLGDFTTTWQRRWFRRLRILESLLVGRPMWAADTQSHIFAHRLREVVSSWRPDIVQAELSVIAQYLPALEDHSAPRVLVDHDPGAGAARELSRVSHGIERLLHSVDMVAWRRFTKKTTASVDAVVVFTERDRRQVEARSGGTHVVTIPLGMELPDSPLDPLGAPPPSVLFAGGFRHGPNADAGLRLVESIFPRVRSRVSDSVLYLVGADPTRRIRAAAGEGVVVTGAVESVDPYLAFAAVVAAPIRIGGGMRVKVIEALAAGKAIVASRRAVEGLDLTDGEQVLLAESDHEFAQAIIRLLENADLRGAIAGNAREWALANLRLETRLDAFDRLYETLLANPGRSVR
jgi:glycosyltransferase involved in cell wall biosynthesis